MKTLRHANSGFTLIELFISMAIFGIMALVAIPSYNVWIQKGHVQGAAESIRDGIQRARAEAVARNGSVEFVLGGDYFWSVSVGGEVIESRGTGEGPDSVTMTMTPDGATTVTFSGVGTVAVNVDGSDSIEEVEVDSTALPGDVDGKLSVIVGSGGARVCSRSVATDDVRSCG